MKKKKNQNPFSKERKIKSILLWFWIFTGKSFRGEDSLGVSLLLYRIGESQVFLCSVPLSGDSSDIWLKNRIDSERQSLDQQLHIRWESWAQKEPETCAFIRNTGTYSVLVLWKTCCVSRESAWWKDPIHAARTLGWGRVAPGPYWTKDCICTASQLDVPPSPELCSSRLF